MNTEIYFKEVVEPTLEHFGIFTPELAKILVMTAQHESGGFKHKRQIGGGPGNGYCQVEMPTHNDNYINYLKGRKSLEKITQYYFNMDAKTFMENKEYEKVRDTLINNDSYNCLMAAIWYLRRINSPTNPRPLPAVDDIVGMANYWKKWYNTPKGGGTPEKFLRDWENRKRV